MNLKLALYYYNIDNFGDQLNVAIFEHYGFRLSPTSKAAAEAVGIGSILGMFKGIRFAGTVLGTGLIDESESFDASQCDVEFVRGPLTWARINNPANKSSVYGDLGILAKRVYGDNKIRRWGVGVVPHHIDYEERSCRESLKVIRQSRLIDVRKPPGDVVREISSCERVVSSSLHGLVVADSYGIPSVWAKFSDNVCGGGFKFNDYFLGMGYSRENLDLSGTIDFNVPVACYLAPSADLVNSKMTQLDKLMRKFKRDLLLGKITRRVKRFINRGRRESICPRQ